jgi:flagellar hook-associated protein 1 FlgK
MGLHAALAVAGRSLEIFTAGVQIAGQNIANANTPGYIREELQLQAAAPYRNGALIFGTGADVLGVRQQIDKYLEGRIHAANTDVSTAAARESIFKQLENEIRELGDGDLSSSLSTFLGTIHDAANQPESAALRQIVLDTGMRFATDISNLRARIDELRAAQTVKTDSLVKEANTLIRKIADLNPRISTLEQGGLSGSDAGALRTQRYDALNRLSEILPVRYTERPDGTVDVYTTNNYLVLGTTIQTLETVTTVDRGVPVQDVRLATTKYVISDAATGGELRGVIEGRDDILGGFVDDLDRIAAAVIREFNRIHASGEGLEGYQSVSAQNTVLDAAVALNDPATGLKFPPQHGSFQIKVTNKLTGITETTTVNVDLDGIGADTTLDSLRSDIDGIANITASITTDGRLKLVADANFDIKFGNDTSGALAGLGINTFFTGHDSGSIGVNPVVADNQKLLATGQGGGPADSSNAILLADFSRTALASLGNVSIEQFYEQTVTTIGQSSASETAVTDGLRAFQQSLQSQREQYSGVSLDEEAIKMLQYQHAFQAAARMISTVDELFTTLLTM